MLALLRRARPFRSKLFVLAISLVGIRLLYSFNEYPIEPSKAKVSDIWFRLLGIGSIGPLSDSGYPIREWIAWHYLAIMALAVLWGAACWSLGDLLLNKAFRLRLPTLERIALGFPLGVFGFEIGIQLLGVINAYGAVCFFVFPLVLVLARAPAWRDAIRRWHRLRALPGSWSVFSLVCILFACLTLVAIYFVLLTPHNAQFDARWKHMALAENYVAHGGIQRSGEGWVFTARPHSTTYAYVWGFMIPFGGLFHRMVLSQNLEFVVFLVTTLVGIPALVRRLAPEAPVTMVWAARFLFPGVLIYDSSLSGGADHFGALMAPAVALALLRAWRRLDLRFVLLTVVFMSAACLVKETTGFLLAPFPFLVLLVRAAYFALSRHRKDPEIAHRLRLGPPAALAVGLLATAPFWLKNWIWFNNPIYPTFSNVFPSDPWSPEAAYRFSNGYADAHLWNASRDWAGVGTTLRAMFDFSFVPNDWKKFHGARPMFGSLFTILWPCLLVLRRVGRTWGLVLWVHVGLFTWYWVHHQDRYLQAILPLMVAVTAVVLLRLWQKMGTLVRSGLVLLIAMQLLVGADAYFLATHAMVGSPLKKMVEMLGEGHKKNYADRFAVEPKMVAVGQALPKGARLLFHEQMSHLGSGHESVQDSPYWQYGIDYMRARTPQDVHAIMKRLGITHIFLNPGKSFGVDSLAGDFMFFDYAYRRATKSRTVSGAKLVTIPDRLPDRPFSDRVVLVNCDRSIRAARYRIADLTRPTFGPEGGAPRRAQERTDDEAVINEWLQSTDFVGVSPKCTPTASIRRAFRKVAERAKKGPSNYDIWLRND